MTTRLRRLLAALILACAAEPIYAVEWTPVVDASALLGQVFQQNRTSSWQGNANLQFTPAMKLTPDWTLIPTYAGEYQGTKSVVELAGGNELFQDSQSHSLNLKAVYRWNSLKIKPSLGYRWDFLRETSDESWGKGLFDYRKPAAGIEAEYAFPGQIKAGLAFDYYKIEFPNYTALESQPQAAGLGREQAAAFTLNSNNLSWTLHGAFPLPFEGGSARLSLNAISRYYPQQHIVANTGDLTSDLRSDDIKSAIGTLLYGRALSKKIVGLLSLQLAETRARSNQAHYDPELNVFTQDYYSYDERSIQPKISFMLGSRRAEFSISYLLIQRDYLGRVAQDAAGTYLNEAINLSQESYLFDLAIPINWGLKLIAHSTVTHSSSNMLYEKSFRYNYNISSHLIGFSYSY